ncbi:type II toxin-antitoxin system RelE/ParE family toxin (plasmid) [Tistrella mobilis]|uniref:type II toxin-antitoxin system RelE/ParE family toxin n=1 Tax=Tistrella mobilis TaxID=171437 RepID=UPI003555E074
MPRLILSTPAVRELAAIAAYVMQRSQDAAMAEAFAADLVMKCEYLASLPGLMGRPRPELAAGLRSFVHRGYVIFFRYIDDRFEVVTVLEGHRDIDGHFSEELPL